MLVLQLLLHMLMVASELQCGQDIMKIINVDLVVLVSYISWNWSEWSFRYTQFFWYFRFTHLGCAGSGWAILLIGLVCAHLFCVWSCSGGFVGPCHNCVLFKTTAFCKDWNIRTIVQLWMVIECLYLNLYECVGVRWAGGMRKLSLALLRRRWKLHRRELTKFSTSRRKKDHSKVVRLS